MKRIASCFIASLSIILFLNSAFSESDIPIQNIFEEGVLAYTKGEYDKAIGLYERTLSLYPQFPLAYNYMALAYRAKGNNNKAISLFNKAIELDEQYAEPYVNLGKIYYAQSDFQKAEYYCKKALEFDPNNESALLSLGWINLLGKSESKEAIKYFIPIVEKGESPYAYFGLGIAYFMQNQKPRTLDMITQLRKKDQENLAQQLEAMVRDKTFIPPQIKSTTPLLENKDKTKDASSIVKDASAQFPSAKIKSNENINVRLREPSNDSNSSELTGAERIRALQKNSLKRNSSY